MKYVWLNIENGQFSNSWSEETHQEFRPRIEDEDIPYNWKLIKYECVTSPDFEFYERMVIK